ncbi:MAG: M14 family zinc carboxypeptidase, partial [Solirubrobacteraceae bacterium]
MVRAALMAIALAGGALASVHVREPAHASAARSRLLGRSEQGRPIFVVRIGDPTAPRVLVFGAIHGNETAGLPIARALERAHTRDDVWIVPDLNPDGVAHGT